ncbi:MAG: bifunctional pyr operon transcriptional regulator/uracil phosphoribosyltransferase PyrR [Gammaproteobacteria bacterium]
MNSPAPPSESLQRIAPSGVDVDASLEAMAGQLRARSEHRPDPLIVGIRTGGVWVAERLHGLLGLDSALGILDISFYRDDFSRIGMHPSVQPSTLPDPVDDRHVILVDDVLHTGRTIRAALNELFDYGRPASVTLVVLVERNGRELPIEAAITGAHVHLGPDEHIKLTGPSPLALKTQTLTTQTLATQPMTGGSTGETP